MSLLVTDTLYGTVVPGGTGPLVAGLTANVEGREMQLRAIICSLLTGLVDSHTSSMTPLKNCVCDVAPMRIGANAFCIVPISSTCPAASSSAPEKVRFSRSVQPFER